MRSMRIFSVRNDRASSDNSGKIGSRSSSGTNDARLCWHDSKWLVRKSITLFMIERLGCMPESHAHKLNAGIHAVGEAWQRVSSMDCLAKLVLLAAVRVWPPFRACTIALSCQQLLHLQRCTTANPRPAIRMSNIHSPFSTMQHKQSYSQS